MAADGCIRVAGSRVTLDTIVAVFDQGETPESIVDQYPGLLLDDVYALVAYYLRNREEVAAYLHERTQKAEAVRREVEARHSQIGLRERLLARRAAKKQ
jgi:uncharacterized protein (DUF433 family)